MFPFHHGSRSGVLFMPLSPSAHNVDSLIREIWWFSPGANGNLPLMQRVVFSPLDMKEASLERWSMELLSHWIFRGPNWPSGSLSLFPGQETRMLHSQMGFVTLKVMDFLQVTHKSYTPSHSNPHPTDFQFNRNQIGKTPSNLLTPKNQKNQNGPVRVAFQKFMVTSKSPQVEHIQMSRV